MVMQYVSFQPMFLDNGPSTRLGMSKAMADGLKWAAGYFRDRQFESWIAKALANPATTNRVRALMPRGCSANAGVLVVISYYQWPGPDGDIKIPTIYVYRGANTPKDAINSYKKERFFSAPPKGYVQKNIFYWAVYPPIMYSQLVFR